MRCLEMRVHLIHILIENDVNEVVTYSISNLVQSSILNCVNINATLVGSRRRVKIVKNWDY